MFTNLSATKKTFRATAADTTKNLLLRNFLNNYERKNITADKYFIDPDLELADGTSVQKALPYMLRWLRRGEPGTRLTASIAVLTAEGGVGKTTLSRTLCSRLHEQDPTIIPIIIQSTQWQQMIQTSLTMEVVWQRAMELALSSRFLNAEHMLTNNTALKILIRERLFVVMFDGFDELCIHPDRALSPKSIIEDLIDLVTPDDDEEMIPARILLTARRTFWDSIKDDVDSSKIDVFRIKGFDNAKRKEYFQRRLSDQKERDLAYRLSRQISGGIYERIPTEGSNEDRPSGVPFILDLIAHYVQDNSEISVNPYMTDPFANLLTDVCQRENTRQSLGIAPADQFKFFEELFLSHPTGVSLDDLQAYLEIFCSVPPDAVRDVTKRFSNHVFLMRAASPDGRDNFEPRYEVIKVYFLARFLASGLNRAAASEAPRILKLLAENSAGETQVLDFLYQQLQRLNESQIMEAVHHALKIVRDSQDGNTKINSKRALFHLVQRLVSIESDKIQRTQRLAELLRAQPSSTEEIIFRDVTFVDQVNNYNLKNAKIFLLSLY